VVHLTEEEVVVVVVVVTEARNSFVFTCRLHALFCHRPEDQILNVIRM